MTQYPHALNLLGTYFEIPEERMKNHAHVSLSASMCEYFDPAGPFLSPNSTHMHTLVAIWPPLRLHSSLYTNQHCIEGKKT